MAENFNAIMHIVELLAIGISAMFFLLWAVFIFVEGKREGMRAQDYFLGCFFWIVFLCLALIFVNRGIYRIWY